MDANNGYKMNLELNVKGMRGIFRDIVLYTLYNLGEAHGYAIRGFINKNLSIYTPSSGILYPTLRELEKEGLVESKWIGRKRVYKLTEKGRLYVENRKSEIEKTIDKVKKAINVLMTIGFFELMNIVRTLWEKDVEIPHHVVEELKKKISEIKSILFREIKSPK